jgi:hypothetical protein
MLLQLYPKVHRRYSSLPVFGPIVESFGAWLLKQDPAGQASVWRPSRRTDNNIRLHFGSTGGLSGSLQDSSLLITNKGTRLAAGLVSSMLSCNLTQTIVR